MGYDLKMISIWYIAAIVLYLIWGVGLKYIISVIPFVNRVNVTSNVVISIIITYLYHHFNIVSDIAIYSIFGSLFVIGVGIPLFFLVDRFIIRNKNTNLNQTWLASSLIILTTVLISAVNS